jgi:hypothetical protein
VLVLVPLVLVLVPLVLAALEAPPELQAVLSIGKLTE